MRKSFLFIAVALCAMITSCNKDVPTVIEASLDVNKTSVTFSEQQQDPQEIKVTSTYPWELTSPADWFTVTPASGEAGETTVTITLNTTDFSAELSEQIVITSEELTKTVNVYLSETPIVETESIKIKAPRRKVVVGESMEFEVTINPEGSTLPGEITWSTSAEEIATIENGVITGVAAGVVTITASVEGLEDATYEMEVTDEFITDGTGEEITFDYLSQFEFSGVTATDYGYHLNSNFTIAVNDVLRMKEEKHITAAAGVIIYIEGLLDLGGENPVSFEKEDYESEDASIYFTGDIEAGGQITNIAFYGVYFRYYGVSDVSVTNCYFEGVTSNNSVFNLGGDGTITIDGCEFVENAYPAISGAANIATGLVFSNNELYKNSWNATNKPQINVTVGGDKSVEILNNTVIGPAEVTMNGGIAVSNMVNLTGSNNVLIEGNDVQDNRYGITLYGAMNATINDNYLLNNNYESNAMNGGSGLSFYYMGTELNIMMSGNHIEGHFWGITNISMTGTSGPNLNLGNLEDEDNYNPGGNVFINNGNNGVLYDLYNNSANTVYAQGNTWNVEVQDQESIEGVIFHKNDNSALGEVIFMPAAE